MKCEFSNSNKFIFINDGAIFSFLILVEVVLLTDIVKYRPSLSQTAQENTFLSNGPAKKQAEKLLVNKYWYIQ